MSSISVTDTPGDRGYSTLPCAQTTTGSSGTPSSGGTRTLSKDFSSIARTRMLGTGAGIRHG